MLHAQTNGGAALETGYAHVAGYYSSTLKAAPVFGLRVIPFEWTHFFADGAFSYSSFQLSKSPGSYMSAAGGDIGINYYYRYRRISPFAGLSAGARYLYFSGEKTDETLHTFKPSIGTRIGIFIEISSRFYAAARTDYSLNTLSGKRFSELTHTAGIMYRFGSSDSPQHIPDTVKINNYVEGIIFLNEGSLASAREQFALVEKNDPAYNDSRKLIDEIDNSTAAFDEGKRLIAENKKIEAIPRLESASLRISEASKLIESLRSELIRDVPVLEKNGIAAYDLKDYPLCISIMRHLLIIDPNNKTAKVYLPRAEKRNEALRKLR